MILNKIEDPRDNLEKARQSELIRYAHACGLNHINEQMPAILIRAELRARHLTNIQIPRRILGATNQPNPIAPPPPDAKIVEVNAASDLARQYAARQQPPAPPPQPERPKRLVERPRSEINQLRDTCKALGIKMERRDNMVTLKQKIEAHGQNAAQLRQ